MVWFPIAGIAIFLAGLAFMVRDMVRRDIR